MVNSRNPNEPVAWMRPEITEDGFTYDSSFRDNDGIVLPQTRIGQGFKPLYTFAAIAAARVQENERIAKWFMEYFDDPYRANAIRALINTNLTGETK